VLPAYLDLPVILLTGITYPCPDKAATAVEPRKIRKKFTKNCPSFDAPKLPIEP
jgi:hypothetical protein